ncbi:anhydro-N-acetylmuramic acid kinase [Micromonospora tulbaghiae]|uniref:Anhydro-N-acetylmuramic acid kinase n=2 Tax=Micromonospora TaxID=1873 RepID=A0AAW4JVP9_9ACTN|nr:anhydro-N-acetylmuramic acid kinase [Micromonospora tulbaghiae]MBO4142844.1 anhydro-N-acetylmuramic acid kinase [Micromonospora tulbaghiae]MDX5457926.1 anhydro-N-acetylmuramic acid kinase [Micromonospora tulbaghiae]SCE85076.1 anhydro-N-acetylmuramic acid kinase [Micromonospora tulbaghiae]
MKIVGLMSGTSYDGVDVVAAEFTADGDTLRLRPLGHRELAYPDDLRAEIGALLPPAATTVEAVCRLDNRLGEVFAEAAAAGVELAGGTADAVVSPGQTVFHWVEDGRVRGTLQLGAPARVAARVGVPVLHDLRSADVAAGGQGAPLVPAFDALLLDPATGAAPRAALNLGGIANLTVVAPGAPVLGYDVGPANALLDAAARRFLDRPCDVDGAHAAAGRVHEALLARLLAEPYYAAPPPKSTGKELFHGGYLDAALAALGEPVAADDVLATLTELTARTVADACDRHRVTEVVAAGGGVRNPTLRARLAALGEGRWRLRTTDELGVPAQAKEAYAFALLGWLSWHGLPGAVPSVTGASRAAVLGSWTPAGPSVAAPRPPAPRRLVVDA